MLRAALVTCLVASPALAIAQQAPQTPAPTQPPATPPQTQTPPAPGAPSPVPGTPTTPVAARTFTTGCGLLIHPVRPERQKDFERFLAYVRDALAKSANPRVRSQASGWRFMRATEPGPNGVVMYVFWIDPAVPNTEYALGPILAEVYTDPAQLSEIWALYTSSVTGGGTLLNLSPVPLMPPEPIVTPPANPPAEQKPAAPEVTTAPMAPPAKPVTGTTAALTRC